MRRPDARDDSRAAVSGTSESASHAKQSLPPPAQIGAYRIEGELGRGGMARVYRAVDDSTGRRLALKQLHIREDLQQSVVALFEREFHTLAQLSHPSVIEVYDYGIGERGPYYTMELIDGGDVRKLAPMPWQQACRIAFDVCSSLALIHSRRLVHRDITPRNVRCTQSGRAKLIDFGAMVPMGAGGHVIGTPAFIAPEVVSRSFVDGRADLFSLGATLYYALTGRAPYAARELSHVLEAWRAIPAPPSALVDGIPPALDQLVMSMLQVEPALRPRGAHEVMERLHVLAGVERDESLDVSRAYLATPLLVGRGEALAVFRRSMQRALEARGGGLMVRAGAGLGRSRLLDAFALDAKLLGATSLRAGASSELNGELAIARALVEQLADLHPDTAEACAREVDPEHTTFVVRALAAEDSPAEAQLSLRDYPDAQAARLAMQTALAQWFLRVSRRHALLVAVDDADRIDEPSAALLAALAHQARRDRLLLAITCEPVTADVDAAAALEVLARQCAELSLRPLDQSELETLLGSVFGDVPNVAMLAARIHAVALGRPRDCMALAQYLVERGAITYAAGTWTLPEQLQVADLPRRAMDVFRARFAQLPPRARTLLQLHALALIDTFSRNDYLRLNPGASAGEIDAAISELLSLDLLRSDGRTYALALRELREIAKEQLGDAARTQLHRELSVLATQQGQCLEAVSHLLSAGLASQAIDLMFETFTSADEPQNLINLSLLPFQEIARVIESTLDAAVAVQRKPRDVYELTRWLFLASVAAEDRMHARTAPALLARLEHDSGLAFFRQIDDAPDPGQRLMQALTRATEQYNATPEAERVYRVDEALSHLVYYAAISIAVGTRTLDGALLESLPGLLEPFAPLSPAIHAIWQNTIATVEISSGNPERAYERWTKLYEQLEHMNGTELKRVDLIRSAIAYGLGMIDAQVGRDAVGRWAAVLDQDPLQQVNAFYLRRALCLHRGDMQSAERFRRKAEVLAVQANIRQMFATVSVVELSIAAMMRDLTGVKQLADRITPLAAQYPGWRPFRELADAHLHRLRGSLGAARAACERALALVAPQGVLASTSILAWWSITTLYIEVLTALGRHEEALAFGERTLATCAERGVGGAAADIQRAVAIAQAKLGDLEGAVVRLDAAIETQTEYGGHGLILGATYEARARVAIWAGDAAAVERYGQLAAHEYRHGRTTPLGARYERLTDEARAAGMDVLPQLGSITGTYVGPTALGGVRATIEHSVTAALQRADDARTRARVALELICEAHAASGGHLYVMRDEGLTLAASLGAEPPDAELARHVASFWQRHLTAADVPTAFMRGPDASSPGSTTLDWSDGRGVPYQPILISAVVAGDRVYVGIAVLIASTHPNADPNAAQITTSVGAHLLDSGDAVAIEA